VIDSANIQSDSALIPSNITASCSSFLTTLNADTSIQDCVTPLINATAAYTPTAGSNASSTDIQDTLTTLCKSDGCADSAIRGWLSGFYSNCSAELTSSTEYNAQVRELYDVLYVVNPLRKAVCSIDSGNQDFCVKSIVSGANNSTSSASASGSASGSAASASGSAAASGSVMLSSFAATWNPIQVAANNLYISVPVAASDMTKRVVNMFSRQEQADQKVFASIITPNMTTYRNTNLPFLFLQPTMKQSTLCTPCTREVMVSYIKWETAFPYALGLSQSPILGGQSELWNAINATCGPTYVKAITSEVGIAAASFNSSSGALSLSGSSGIGSIIAGSAFVAGAISLLF
jgi:hypothetical protein